ncbi:hypothetical protein OZX68_06830 [Streptococcaceae bacterium ESL0729]|nr:hypothetical protein OZX68_06830 [Streptococcaceae bacterium ESL0729]
MLRFFLILLSFTGLFTGGILARANEMLDSTPVAIIIEDGKSPVSMADFYESGGDLPLSDQLSMTYIPDTYMFENYFDQRRQNLTSKIPKSKNQIEIFNDQSSRSWYLKASIPENHLTEVKSKASYKITSFGNVASGATTGHDFIIAKSEQENTWENTGFITQFFKDIRISFEDSRNKLKFGDSISGKISYDLYQVPKT